MRITYSECVFVALVIQRTMSKHHTVNCSLPHCTVQYFSILFHERNIFEKKKQSCRTYHVFDFLYNLSETFIILRRYERDMVENVYSTLCKVPVVTVRFS